MKKILFVFGTRPEIIKLAPVIRECKKTDGLLPVLCNTGQQTELSKQTVLYFGLKAEFNLNVMEPNQILAEVEAKILKKLQKIITENKYDAIIAQGDTITVFCAAQIAFYNKIPFFHVEAGLRSNNVNHPFPEEMIRQCTARIAALHFAPTKQSQRALLKENIDPKKIHITGNTGIDALYMLSEKKEFWNEKISKDKDIVLVTVHRRENHGKNLDDIIKSIEELAKKYRTVQFILPVHPNPNVKEKIHQLLRNIKNILLLEPLDYPVLVQIIKKAKLIMTDSGGIQEEAPSFGCPVLVLRETTERVEGIEAGFAKLLGTNKDLIIKEASAVLDKPFEATRLLHLTNPYGDGKASKRIVDIIVKYFLESTDIRGVS